MRRTGESAIRRAAILLALSRRGRSSPADIRRILLSTGDDIEGLCAITRPLEQFEREGLVSCDARHRRAVGFEVRARYELTEKGQEHVTRLGVLIR